MDLKNKNILFLSVSTFNYEKIIAEKLRSFGAIVKYYDERPSNSIFTKGIIRLKRDFYQKQITKYYRKISKEIETEKYDYFFLIKGEVVPQFFIDDVKKYNPQIKSLYYTFDSFSNNPRAKAILHNFDKKFSFDRKDSVEHNLSFRPLFFSDEYKNIKSEKSALIDTLFIGTAHSDRYIISEALSDWCEKNNLKSFSFYFSPSRFAFWFFKLFDTSFKSFSYSKLTFKSLTHSEIIELYTKSKVILDINHPKQEGLTMRVFEALGAKKKIITTNKDIINYPFYDSNNIFIIDRNNIQFELDFFEKPFNQIEEKLDHRMSLNGWVEELFTNEKAEPWF